MTACDFRCLLSLLHYKNYTLQNLLCYSDDDFCADCKYRDRYGNSGDSPPLPPISPVVATMTLAGGQKGRMLASKKEFVILEIDYMSGLAMIRFRGERDTYAVPKDSLIATSIDIPDFKD